MRKRYRTQAEVTEDITCFRRNLKRLSESFHLEKEDALETGGAALEKLRDRVRTHYGPQQRRLISELRQLRHRLKTMQGLPSAIFHNLDDLETNMKDAGAHFTGTVNRLLRCRLQGEDQCTE